MPRHHAARHSRGVSTKTRAAQEAHTFGVLPGMEYPRGIIVQTAIRASRYSARRCCKLIAILGSKMDRRSNATCLLLAAQPTQNEKLTLSTFWLNFLCGILIGDRTSKIPPVFRKFIDARNKMNIRVSFYFHELRGF